MTHFNIDCGRRCLTPRCHFLSPRAADPNLCQCHVYAPGGGSLAGDGVGWPSLRLGSAARAACSLHRSCSSIWVPYPRHHARQGRLRTRAHPPPTHLLRRARLHDGNAPSQTRRLHPPSPVPHLQQLAPAHGYHKRRMRQSGWRVGGEDLCRLERSPGQRAPPRNYHS